MLVISIFTQLNKSTNSKKKQVSQVELLCSEVSEKLMSLVDCQPKTKLLPNLIKMFGDQSSH